MCSALCLRTGIAEVQTQEMAIPINKAYHIFPRNSNSLPIMAILFHQQQFLARIANSIQADCEIFNKLGWLLCACIGV
jgi:hypothetical protein